MFILCAMNNTHTRGWNVLSWNVSGINSQGKWDAIRDKINESSASIMYLQETKRDNFEASYLSKFCPRHMSNFSFSPSVGASGGLLTVWNGRLFSAEEITINAFSIVLKLTSHISGQSFHVANIYGPCTPAERQIL